MPNNGKLPANRKYNNGNQWLMKVNISFCYITKLTMDLFILGDE